MEKLRSVLFLSRPRSEGWPHHGRTFSIYLFLLSSDWLFHRESCPRLDVVYPSRARSSSPAYSWYCSLRTPHDKIAITWRHLSLCRTYTELTWSSPDCSCFHPSLDSNSARESSISSIITPHTHDNIKIEKEFPSEKEERSSDWQLSTLHATKCNRVKTFHIHGRIPHIQQTWQNTKSYSRQKKCDRRSVR